MTTLLVCASVALILLCLNAFFVLAEFAAVKVRPSRVEQLVGEGKASAKLVQHIQTNLDEYLAVSQLGITFASIGLGAVIQPAFSTIFDRVFGAEHEAGRGIAMGLAVLFAGILHVVLGEQVPKMLGILRAEQTALYIARPLHFFRWLLMIPLKILSGATGLILRLFGIRGPGKESDHSEEELRIILAKSQNTGLMSFRRLLLLENIFDLGDLRVRDAMRSRDSTKVLRAGAPWEENLKIVRDSRLSRFPLVDQAAFPVGVVHVKDLFYEGQDKLPNADLRKMARPYLTAAEDQPLENLLGEFQHSRVHLAMVKNPEGRWTGVISLEDIIEEITGTIEDEFETEPPIHLSDGLTAGRVVVGIDASSLEELIGQVFGRLDPKELPLPIERVVKAVLERERAMSTYLGNGLAVPHARLEGLEKPVVLFARSEAGVPIKGREEKAHLAFVLLTPSGSPRIQVRLLARVAALLSSEYVDERLRAADSPDAVVEVIRAGESITLS